MGFMKRNGMENNDVKLLVWFHRLPSLWKPRTNKANTEGPLCLLPLGEGGWRTPQSADATKFLHSGPLNTMLPLRMEVYTECYLWTRKSVACLPDRTRRTTWANITLEHINIHVYSLPLINCYRPGIVFTTVLLYSENCGRRQIA